MTENDYKNDELIFLKNKFSDTSGTGPHSLVKKVNDNAVIARRGTTIASKRHSDITMFFDQFIKDKYEGEKANFSLNDDEETQKKKRIRQSYIVVFYLLKLLITLEFTDIFETTKIENEGRSFTAHTFADTISGSGLYESIYKQFKETNYKKLIDILEQQDILEQHIKIKDFETAFKDITQPEIKLKDAIYDIENSLKLFNKESFSEIRKLIKYVKLDLEKSTTSSPTKSTTSTPTTSTATNRVGDAAKGASEISSLFSGLIGGKKSRKRCNKSKRKNKNNKTRKAKPKRKSRKNSRS
jgi:hypothetical protein